MHKHTNTGKPGFYVRPFFAPIADSRRPDPRSHGGVCIMEHCRCGAVRATNVNGPFYERGKWTGGQS